MRKLSFIFVIVFALTAAAAAAQAQTRNVKQIFDRGTRAARAGEFDEALDYYRRAIDLSGNEPVSAALLAKIYFNIGVCLYQSKRPGEAVKEFEKSIELSGGGYQKAFYALGMAQTELRNWEAAAEAFREALRLKSDDGESWFDLALVLVETKDFEAAENAFQNAAKYKSIASADAHNNVGVMLALKGDLARAENEFKIALRKSGGKSVEARNNLKFCASYKQSSGQSAATLLSFSPQRK